MAIVRIAITAMLALAVYGCTAARRESEPEPRSARDGERNLISRMEATLANRLFEDAFEEMLARSPEFQTRLGIHDNDDRWDDISDEFAVETHQIMERQWENLQRSVDFDKLDQDTRLSYRLFQYDVEHERRQFPYRFHNYPVDQMSGLHAEVPAFLINIHPSSSEQDMRNYVARLRGIEPLFAQLIANMKLRAEMGIVPPLFVFPHVLAASRNVISGRPFANAQDESVLLADFREKCERLDLPEQRRRELMRAAESALLTSVGPAYETLIDYLTELQTVATSDDGVWKFPDGEAFYRTMLEALTTTNMTADEIHELGLREVWRIHGEMLAIMRQVGFEGTMQEFFQHLRTDERFYFPNTPEGKQAYLDLAVALIGGMSERLDELFLRRPPADLIVKAVEPFRESSAGKAFYQRPAPDGSRPGTFYVNLHDLSTMPIWELEALAYHEAIPGHHMQLSIASAIPGLPRFRQFGHVTAYIEGWALYMERIPKEIGFYTDPYSDFGRLAQELWRAARLVVDTGIHSKGWSREEAIHFLDENSPNPHDQAVKAIERYIVMPGQATAYKIGMLKLLELRDRASARLGSRFDIREFHDLILRAGPLPLSILEELVEEWIADAAAATG